MKTSFPNFDPTALNNRFEEEGPGAVLEWVNSTFGSDAVHVTGFGIEGIAIFDMLYRIDSNARVLTVDTLRLPSETYNLFDKFEEYYNTKIEIIKPDLESIREMIIMRGENLFYESLENRKLCCSTRKVQPLDIALADTAAWITGLHRDQGMGRTQTKFVEWDPIHRNWKINPIANWSFEQCKQYVEANGLPYNSLHDRGYPSIGCKPCTRAIKPGESIRAGRWWWENEAES